MPEKSNMALPRREFLGRMSAASAAVACGGAAFAADGRLSAPALQRYVGESFKLAAEEGSLRIKLASADAAPQDAQRPSHVRQDPFTLIFEAPEKTQFKDQICRLQHAEFGTIDAFVSAVGSTDQNGKLQVVFG